MFRTVSILAVMWAVAVSGCTRKADDPKAPAAGQEDRSTTAADSAGESRRTVATQQEESTPNTVEPSTSDPPARVGAGESPDVLSAPAATTGDSAPVIDAAMQSQVGQWLEQMASDAAVERRAAGDALSARGEAAMAYIVRGLREGTAVQKRGAATYLIGRISPRDEEAVTALIQAMTSPDVELQRVALQAVERLPDETLRQALPALETVAKDPAVGEAYRSRALRAIAKLGPAGSPAIPSLVALATEGEDLNLRRASYFAMSKVASAQVAEEFFQEQLKSDSPPDLRRLAAKWLGTVTRSEASLLCLIHAFGDPDQSVRLEAVDALVAIGKPAVGAVVASLDSANVDVRRHGVLTLGKMGYFAAEAAPALQARLADPDEQVRELAAAALKMVQTR